MDYLKIKNNKGIYSLDGHNWRELDKINKEHLLSLLDLALGTEFGMDEYEESKLSNQAQQIIYKNIHDKFNQILENKSRFKDESEAMYKDAIEKYSTKIESEE